MRRVAETALLVKMREMLSVTSFQLKNAWINNGISEMTVAFLRMKRGVRFGVCMPRALLAITPRSGVLSGAFEYR